ncbi:MAG: hypothetical protein INQ03_06555 [Candidatus Heimdallarchaeota archaeon]|nr:hypothetical protein [Candidatus Heimdallarchaeota archaeon]
MSIDTIINQGGTLVIDPYENNRSPDEFLTKYGNLVDSICIVAKSERGSTYYQSSTAPKDPSFGEVFSAFSQITTDIGIQTYALVHGNHDVFFSRDPNFQMQKSGGIPLANYVCLNQRIYWQYLSEIAAEITTKTSVDGIILKDVHYPRENTCFCDNCRMSFSSDYDYNRDFSLEQLKRSPKIDNWMKLRTQATNGLISNVVQRVHMERTIDILSEILLDPQTEYFEGASTHFGQDIHTISQSSSHLLFHLYPWSNLPTTQDELDNFFEKLSPYLSLINSVTNSIYLWGPNEQEFEFALKIKDALGSKEIFFTEKKPNSYLNRRSLHLDMGV